MPRYLVGLGCSVSPEQAMWHASGIVRLDEIRQQAGLPHIIGLKVYVIEFRLRQKRLVDLV
jgi:hypothetical protein